MKFMNIVKKYGVRAAAVPVVLVTAASAHAELPAAVATSLTSLETDAASLMTLLYGAMIAITGGFIVFGLVKKGMRKAAS